MENRKIGGVSSETTEPIDIRYGVGNYVGDMTPCAKTQNDNRNGGVWTNV